MALKQIFTDALGAEAKRCNGNWTHKLEISAWRIPELWEFRGEISTVDLKSGPKLRYMKSEYGVGR